MITLMLAMFLSLRISIVPLIWRHLFLRKNGPESCKNGPWILNNLVLDLRDSYILIKVEKSFPVTRQLQIEPFLPVARADDAQRSDVQAGQRPVQVILVAADAVGHFHVAAAAALGAGGGVLVEARHALEDRLYMAALRAGHVGDDFAVEF